VTDASLVATATGSLERTPLSNLLIYCLDKGLNGTLVLQSPENIRHAIYFHKGSPAKVRTGDSVALLGRVLIEMEVCTLPDIEDALVAARTLQCPMGEALMQAGKLDTERLLAALKAQAQRKITSLFGLSEASAYGFFEGRNLLEGWGGPELTPLDPLLLIWQGVKTSPQLARMDAALGGLGDLAVRLHVDGDFKRFGLSDRAKGLVDLLKAKPMPLGLLLDAGVATELEVKQTIYTFLITRHLDLGGSARTPVGFAPPDSGSVSESGRTAVARVKLKSMARARPVVEVGLAGTGEPPDGSPSSREPAVQGAAASPRAAGAAPAPAAAQAATPAKPPGLAELIGMTAAELPPASPEVEARRKEIRERAENIDREDFFTMLGLPKEAHPDIVKSAYFQLAKRWHPDRLSGELSDVRDQAGKVFARLSEAFQTLTDGDRRKQYLDLMKQGGGSPEETQKVTMILEAQVEFQKAEILLKKGDLAGAEKLAARAADKDPEQVDYLALLSWLRATQPTASSEVIEASCKSFDEILSREGNHQRSLWYRALLRKRMGRESEAMLDFKRLLELDPRHIDATREVRVYEMRQGTKKPAAEKPAAEKPAAEKSNVPFGDLFGKLFKK
jgi:curved DNA-binding protein CbpA